MVPQFPIFRKIDINDRNVVARFLPREPYSDYNFTNLWCWDTDQKRMVSQLNGNLVIMFTDYVSKKLFLSFCGSKKPVSTARTLLHYAHERGIEPVLKYVPDATARTMKKSTTVLLASDLENFDYIFSTAHIAKAEGGRFKKKRQLANKFLKLYPDSLFTVKKQLSSSVQAQILSTMKQWRKKKKFSKAQSEHEKKALERLLKNSTRHPVILSAIYRQNTMLAFSIDEIVSNKFALSHFLKADSSYTGVYEFLNQQTAAYLEKGGIKYWNWEQDLNIEGLRNLKMSYRPIRFLKKHKITLRHNTIPA